MSFQPSKTSEIIITTASQLAGTLRSDVVYVIDGWIDMASQSITVPTGGLFLTGNSYFVCGLYSTANSYTMFIDGGGGVNYSGDFHCSELSFYASGTSSKLFDLDNNENSGAIEFDACNIGDFAGTTTSLGELTAYRQFRTNNCGFFRVQDGLTFSGTWSGGFRITDSIVLAQAASSTLFKVGTSLLFEGRCISDINAASVNPTTITYDFAASNFDLDGGFQLTGASFAPNSAISVTTDGTSIKAFFRDCVEIANTVPGAEMEWTTEAPTTLTVDTPAKVAGTTTTTNNTWFTQTGNNELTYNSNLSKDYRITVSATVDGGANDIIVLYLRQYDASAAGYVNLKTKSRSISNVLGGLDVADFSFGTTVNLALNDRIELWMENQSDGTDATLIEGAEVLIQEA